MGKSLSRLIDDATCNNVLGGFSKDAIQEHLKKCYGMVKEFGEKAKLAGYTRLDCMAYYCGSVEANVYDSKRGIKLTYNIKTKYEHRPQSSNMLKCSKPPKIRSQQYVVFVRQNSVYKSSKFFSSFDTAIDYAAKEQGTKRGRRNSEFKWRKATADDIRVDGDKVKNNRHIHVAELHGVFHLEGGRLMAAGSENPDVNAYPVVKAHDFIGRTLYFVMRGENEFMLALPRGSIIAVTDEKTLFTNGQNPFDTTNHICQGDIALVTAAIQVGLKQ